MTRPVKASRPAPPATSRVTPLDPASAEGKRVAAALSKTCADIERNIAARKAVEQRSTA